MRQRDLHIHSTFSDGKNTPEEIVLAAIGAGMKQIGFAEHNYTYYDETYCMMPENIIPYQTEIRRLKEKYKGQIEISCGIEQDLYSAEPYDMYDHVVASTHYMCKEGAFWSVDDGNDLMRMAAFDLYDGDIYALIEDYFETASHMAEKLHPDIIGHIDLIKKFNLLDPLFDEHHPRYRAAWQKAVDALLPYGIPFEVNYGALSRNYRYDPYPSAEIQEYILSHGGKLIFSSDAHTVEAVLRDYGEDEDIAKVSEKK